jgi:hypothetical protein
LTGRAALSTLDSFISTGRAALTTAKFIKLGLFGTRGVLSWHHDVGLGASVLRANGLCSTVSVDNVGRAELAISCCD